MSTNNVVLNDVNEKILQIALNNIEQKIERIKKVCNFAYIDEYGKLISDVTFVERVNEDSWKNKHHNMVSFIVEDIDNFNKQLDVDKGRESVEEATLSIFHHIEKFVAEAYLAVKGKELPNLLDYDWDDYEIFEDKIFMFISKSQVDVMAGPYQKVMSKDLVSLRATLSYSAEDLGIRCSIDTSYSIVTIDKNNDEALLDFVSKKYPKRQKYEGHASNVK